MKKVKDLLLNEKELNHDKCWNFFDWFCAESSLERKAKALLTKLKWLVSEGLVSPEAEVTFKNNCPMSGSTYDDMRFSMNGKFTGGVCPASGHNVNKGEASLWFFDEAEVMTELKYPSWSELKKGLSQELKCVVAAHFS